MNISECAICPKCNKKFLRTSCGKPVLGKEMYCHYCHEYWGVDELVNEWGYDLGDFGDCFPLDVYDAIERKNNFAKNNGRHPWMNLPVMKEWDTPEEDKAWDYLSDRLVSTNWVDFDTVSTFQIDEPQFKSVKERDEAYEMVDRMFLDIPEWSEGCSNQGIDIGLGGYPI
jgi:hypothetical protein